MRCRLGAFLVVLGFAVSAVLAGGVAEAHAVVVPVAPTWPIPLDAPAGPPPIPTLPAATGTSPPADEIADPVTAAAVCGGWYLQSDYGDRWPATSTWWEYRCSYEDSQYHDTCAGPACNAWCPDCYWETKAWSDYFYWDGSTAVLYGEAYSDSRVYDGEYSSASAAWWDGPTARWYQLGSSVLTVSKCCAGAGEVSSSPAGISCGATCQASFDAGTLVTLTATPDPFSAFTGWSGACSGTGSCQVTLDQARSATAYFDPTIFSLTVSKAGSGSGQVSSSPAGISCGATCLASFDPGTVVTLTAIPDPSSAFTGWSGACSGTGSCQVTLDQARSVTATFELKTFDLTVSKAGSGSGQVSSSPAGIGCGGTCLASFDAGVVVTLSAAPEASSTFTGWSGDCSGIGSCQVTMDRARSVTATFAPDAPPQASFTVVCSGLSCSFDASASTGSEGTIQAYGWDFGDGSSASGKIAQHTYADSGSYTVKLTVTGNGGATGTASRSVAVTVIRLSARGYKLKGVQRVDLSWSGSSADSYDVDRDGRRIARVSASAYTDTLGREGSGSYRYKVCEAGTSICSEQITVTF